MASAKPKPKRVAKRVPIKQLLRAAAKERVRATAELVYRYRARVEYDCKVQKIQPDEWTRILLQRQARVAFVSIAWYEWGV